MNNQPTTGKQDQQHPQQSNREISKKGIQEKHNIYITDLGEQGKEVTLQS